MYIFKIYRLIIILSLIPFFSCDLKEDKVDIPEKEEVVNVEVFDPVRHLNKYNSSGRLYVGTSNYNDVIKNKKVVFETKYRSDLFPGGSLKYSKVDSVSSWVSNDTLFVSHIFMAQGRCLNIYPYLENKVGFLKLNAPEVLEGEIIIEEGDTSVIEPGCSLTNMIEFIFKIPMQIIHNQNILRYNRKVIKLRNN